jgi:hypothetical protein
VDRETWYQEGTLIMMRMRAHGLHALNLSNTDEKESGKISIYASNLLHHLEGS